MPSGLGARAATSAEYAADEHEEEDAPECTRETYDEGFVVADPGADLFSDGGTRALAIITMTTATTGSSVQEILLHAVAYIGPEFRRCAR